MRLEGLSQFKKFNDLIGTRGRNLPTTSILPRPIKFEKLNVTDIIRKIRNDVNKKTASRSLRLH
jgi:hypothetical protein